MRCSWRSPLQFTLTFALEIVRLTPNRRIQLHAVGDLNGLGAWEFHKTRRGTEILILWEVETDKAWMNALAPLCRPLFAWSHAWLMDSGEAGLNAFLKGKRQALPGQSLRNA